MLPPVRIYLHKNNLGEWLKLENRDDKICDLKVKF